MSHLNEEEIREFHTEANELLDQAEKDLLMLDVTESAGALFNSIFRVFHSLKGGSGMLGLDELQGHMHKLENLLAKMKGNDPALKEQSGFFLNGVDVARKMLNGESAEFDYEPAGKSENAKARQPDAAPAPAKIPAPAPAPAPTPAKAAPPKAKRNNLPLVYAVDDEPMIVELLKEHLSDIDAEVETFTCPKALLEAAQKARPDLILSDMRMPGLSGLELSKEVRALDPEIPIILISAHLSKEVLMDGINTGVFAVIEKPFTETSVVNHAMTALKHRRLSKLLNRTLNLLLYQYSDLDDFLKASNKEDVRLTLKQEVNAVIEQRKQLRAVRKG